MWDFTISTKYKSVYKDLFSPQVYTQPCVNLLHQCADVFRSKWKHMCLMKVWTVLIVDLGFSFLKSNGLHITFQAPILCVKQANCLDFLKSHCHLEIFTDIFQHLKSNEFLFFSQNMTWRKLHKSKYSLLTSLKQNSNSN